MADNRVLEEINEHDYIGLWGSVFFLNKDKEGVGIEVLIEYPYFFHMNEDIDRVL